MTANSEQEPLESRVQRLLELVSNSKECELKEYGIDHDGNECVIRMKTVRKILRGEW